MSENTTRDRIQIDLDGSIGDAIKKLRELEEEYPNGTISLENEYEYGESYASLFIDFKRVMTPAEIELAALDAKLSEYAKMQSACRAFQNEKRKFPRMAAMRQLEKELGAFAKNTRGRLQIFDDKIVMYEPLFGAYTRDGTLVLRTLGLGDYAAAMAKQLGLKLPEVEVAA